MSENLLVFKKNIYKFILRYVFAIYYIIEGKSSSNTHAKKKQKEAINEGNTHKKPPKQEKFRFFIYFLFFLSRNITTRTIYKNRIKEYESR